jgi:hypothetical protein
MLEQSVQSSYDDILVLDWVDMKWQFQFFAKYDYPFLLDVIIAIIVTFFAKAIIAISQLSLSISLE